MVLLLPPLLLLRLLPRVADVVSGVVQHESKLVLLRLMVLLHLLLVLLPQMLLLRIDLEHLK